MHKLVGYPEHWKIIARFVPKNRDTLKPEMVPYIGMEFDLEYAGTSDDDEAFPRQHRWMPTREFEKKINMDTNARAKWIPDEDLGDIRPYPPS